jgi:hypothetical protein
MYGSDVTNRNRANTLYINSVLKNQEFTSGKSIRIDRQKGGTDYQYLTNVEFGNIIDTTYDTYLPLRIITGSNPNIFAIYNLNQINLGATDGLGAYLIYDAGTVPTDPSSNAPYTYNGGRMIDDGYIQIPTGGRDFYFFGINYGAANTIYWNANNALTFGSTGNAILASLSKNSVPAILIGNYDRTCSALYYSSYFSSGNLFSVLVIVAYFSDYYTDTSDFDKGKYQIRLIRELSGDKRQWVEVTVISAVPSPGYSNNRSVTYPSGLDASGNPIDSNSFVIDSTKNSPYDITNGTTFQNVCGTAFSTVSPQAGTSFLYQSDSTGTFWNFSNNAYVPV